MSSCRDPLSSCQRKSVSITGSNRSNHRLQVRTNPHHDHGGSFIYILIEAHITHRCRCVSSDAPAAPLNFSAVSAQSPFDRDAVEGCVRETLHLLLRAACTRHSVLHTFPGIGVLAFRQRRVKMRFSRDFISAFDRTGKLSAASTNVSYIDRVLYVCLKPDEICEIIPG